MRQRKGSSDRDAERPKDNTLCKNPEDQSLRLPASSITTCHAVSGWPPTSPSLCVHTVHGLKSTAHFAQGGPDSSLPNPGLSLPCHSHTPLPPFSPAVPYFTRPRRVEVVLPDSVSLQFQFEVIILIPRAGSRGTALERKLCIQWKEPR